MHPVFPATFKVGKFLAHVVLVGHLVAGVDFVAMTCYLS